MEDSPGVGLVGGGRHVSGRLLVVTAEARMKFENFDFSFLNFEFPLRDSSHWSYFD